MSPLLSQLIPLLYAGCFLVLLWQAFRIMARGFQAVPRPGDSESSTDRGIYRANSSIPDRTGRLTVHPELLDAEGQITREDLLTVRFGVDNEQPIQPDDIS